MPTIADDGSRDCLMFTGQERVGMINESGSVLSPKPQYSPSSVFSLPVLLRALSFLYTVENRVLRDAQTEDRIEKTSRDKTSLRSLSLQLSLLSTARHDAVAVQG